MMFTNTKPRESFWVAKKRDRTHYDYFCHNCGRKQRFRKTPFCPMCGFRMIEKDVL